MLRSITSKLLPEQEATEYVGQPLTRYVGQKVDAAAARHLLLSQLRDGLMVQAKGPPHLQFKHCLEHSSASAGSAGGPQGLQLCRLECTKSCSQLRLCSAQKKGQR